MEKFTCIFTDGFGENFGKIWLAGGEKPTEGNEGKKERVEMDPMEVIGNKWPVDAGKKALDRAEAINKDKIASQWDKKESVSSAFRVGQRVEVTAKTLNLRNIHTGEVERKLQKDTKDTKDTVMISNAVTPIKVNGITFVNVKVNGGEYYAAEKYLKPAKLEGQYMITSNLKYDKKSKELTIDGEPLSDDPDKLYPLRQEHIKKFGQRVLLPTLVERTGDAGLKYEDLFGENGLYKNNDIPLKFLVDGARIEFRENKLDFKLVSPDSPSSFISFRTNGDHKAVAAYDKKVKETLV